MNVTLLSTQAIGLKTTWVTRLISNSNQGWKKLVNITLPLKNNNFWECNFKEQDCRAIFAHYKKIPYFWKDVIIKWSKFNFSDPTGISSIIAQPLWFNSFIRNSSNAIILYTKAYESGIFTMKDLIIDGKFATF